MRSTNTLISDIHQAIKAATGFREPKPDRKFHKHNEYICYGLNSAAFDKIMKLFRPRILNIPLQERLDLAAKLLAMHIGELGNTGIYILTLSVKELNPCHFDYLGGLFEDFRSWSHVDHICIYVMKPLLKKYTEAVLSLLEKWNSSPNRWKRRASVVTFTREVAVSGEFTDVILRFCDNLIWDPEDIVQKGVGWALKDNLRSAPDRIISYIKELRRKGVSLTITLYAIRDLKSTQRQQILSVKKGKMGSGLSLSHF